MMGFRSWRWGHSEQPGRSREEIDAAIVRGYSKYPPGGSDEWGDLDAQIEADHRRTMAELDREDGGWE